MLVLLLLLSRDLRASLIIIRLVLIGIKLLIGGSWFFRLGFLLEVAFNWWLLSVIIIIGCGSGLLDVITL